MVLGTLNLISSKVSQQNQHEIRRSYIAYKFISVGTQVHLLLCPFIWRTVPLLTDDHKRQKGGDLEQGI